MVITLPFLLLISTPTLNPKEQWGSQINETNLLFWLINDLYFGAWFPLHHIWLLLWLWIMLGQKIMCQHHCDLPLCILPPYLPHSEVLASLSLPFLLSRYFKSSSCVSLLFHYRHPSATIFGCGHLCLCLSTLHLSCLPSIYVPVPLLAPNCTLVYC